MRTIDEVLDERQAILTEKDQLSAEAADIGDQLARARAEWARGARADQSWYNAATVAKRRKGHRCQKLQTKLGALRREEDSIRRAYKGKKDEALWRALWCLDRLRGDTTHGEAEELWARANGLIEDLSALSPDWRTWGAP